MLRLRLQLHACLAVIALGVSLAGVAACSPAGFKEWASQVQNSSATGFAEQESRRQLSAWQAAGEGGTVRRPAPPSSETPAAGAADKPGEEPPAPPPPPQYIFITPAPAR